MRWLFRKQVASNKEEARRHYNAKDYKKAEPFLLSMLKTDPDDVWALDVLSRLYMNTQKHEHALSHVQRLMRLQPNNPEIVKRLLNVAVVTHSFEILRTHIRRLNWCEDDAPLIEKIVTNFAEHPKLSFLIETIALDSDLFYPKLLWMKLRLTEDEASVSIEEVSSLLIPSLIESREYVLCLELFERFGLEELKMGVQRQFLTSVEDKIPDKRILIKQLIANSRYHEAIEFVKSILQILPNDIPSLENMTFLGSKTKQNELVIGSGKKLIELHASSLSICKRLTKAAIEAGDVDTILLSIDELSNHDVNFSETLRNAYSIALMKGDESAIIKLESYSKSGLQQLDLLVTKKIHQGQYSEATRLIDEGLREHPGEILLLHRKANILRMLGDIEGCIHQCDVILALNPQHVQASILRTQMGTKVWDEEKVEIEYQQMVERFPKVLKFHHQLLNFAFSAKKDMKWSLEVIENALEHYPNDERLLLFKALASAKQGHEEKAKHTIENALLKFPTSGNALIAAAQVAKECNNPSEQLDFVNKLLTKQGLSPLISTSEYKISPEFLSSPSLQDTVSSGLVSVIMTTYKHDPLLDVAINSILNQTYKEIELIIIDDCSPDSTFFYLEERAKQEPRLRVFQMKENGGTYLAKNFGIQQAKGIFFAFMDSDDYAHPQKIERQINELNQNSQIKGIVHQCIRIDEDSNIEFRGIGPFRMSCISLLIRKEVVERMGFFDSLRVGADTEFIERIDAVFGDGSLIELPDLTLFMMRHSTSLTGGGAFHIDWRSVSGQRLVHHNNFRLWHREIKNGLSEGYMPRHLTSRPFVVSDEQKSVHHLWNDSFPLFSSMIKNRKKMWWEQKKEVWQKTLSSKRSGRFYVENLGFKVPFLFWSGKEIEEIPEFSFLPENFVIKPSEGWSSKHVYCMKNGFDILTHKQYSRTEIIEALKNDDFLLLKKPEILIEELLQPEEAESQFSIPRDYKFFCFGEEIALVHVVLRLSEVDASLNQHHYLDSNFHLLPFHVLQGRPQSEQELEKPKCWDEMVSMVRQIGKELGIFMRIDVFPTIRGCVFGEFTPTPHVGGKFVEEADQYLGLFWKGEEGVE